MTHTAPHPDQIAMARHVGRCNHSHAKSILRRGFQHPLRVSKNDLAAIKLLLKGSDDPVKAWLSSHISTTWDHGTYVYNQTVWFKDSETFTYAKMIT
jgi:hypothetical protein